ncbi:MAG: hypothetical protein J1F68_00765 [Clostridiales bacterium]|nr:hypothetical protein [Clostridiales bacterium]
MGDKNGNGGSFVGFLAFCVTMFAAILYLLAMALSFFEIDIKIIDTLQSVASVIMICIVSVTGWRFVKTKSMPWKLVYILVLLAVVASVVIPVAVQFAASNSN